MNMEEVFNEIKNKSAHMQDLRDDPGHVDVVTAFAKKLCDILKANEKLVIPAAILHDVGYYGMDKGLIREMMEKKLSEEQENKIKNEHMERGARFAEKLLNEITYDPKLIKEIVEIVRRHDLKDECRSVEEKIVRDADKLARFSKIGFYVDVKRRKCTALSWYEKLSKNFDKPDYFRTKEAKQIAMDELEERKREFSVS